MICVTSKCKCTLMNQRKISSKNGAKVMQYQVWEGAGSSISEAVGSRSEYPAVELSVSSHEDDPGYRKSGNWSQEPGSWNLGDAKMATGVEGHSPVTIVLSTRPACPRSPSRALLQYIDRHIYYVL